jgi:hypothetical protein
VHV